MNWITRWKKIGIKVKRIFKKQPTNQDETDWKNCPQCKKISYKPDLFNNSYICECSFHFDLPPKLRLDSLFDAGYEMIEAPDSINPDPLDFEVKKQGKVTDSRFQIDGMAGATITTQGVHRLVRFWLGEQGFGKYLTRPNKIQTTTPKQ